MGEHLLDLLPLSDTNWLLDVGTGPGGLISTIRQHIPTTQIIAIDISARMLAIAPPSTNLHYSQMDASRLALVQNRFDLALLAFVLFHYPDIPAGLRELMRVLRPGAVVGSAVFHTSPDFEAKQIWDTALAKETAKTNTTVIDLDAVDRTWATNRAEKSKALFDSAGYIDVRTTEKRFVYQWDPDAYRAFRSSFGTSGEKFRSLPIESRSRLIRSVRERYAQLPTKSFRFEPIVLYTIAKKPAT
jgi:ubiquinone/menaquinone biosynthesis C-methylase UbiE